MAGDPVSETMRPAPRRSRPSEVSQHASGRATRPAEDGTGSSRACPASEAAPSHPPPLLLIAAVILLLSGALARLWHLEDAVRRSPDELIYSQLSHGLLERGTAGLRGATSQYLSDPRFRVYPPPTRTGYLWLLAGAMKLTGSRDARAGAYLSLAASLGTLLVAAVVALRFLPAGAALAALLFVAASPVELALARRAWADAPLGLAAFLAVWSAAELSRRPGRRLWQVAFVLSGCLAMTIKETGAVVVGLCILWLAGVALSRRDAAAEWLALAWLWCAGAVATVSWLAYSVGGLSTLAEVLGGLPGASAANPYDMQYQSGPWYGIPQALFAAAPLTTVAALAGLLPCLTRPLSEMPSAPGWRPSSREVAGMCFVLIGFLLTLMAQQNRANLRYCAPVFGPFHLVAGVGIWWPVRMIRDRLTGARWRMALVAAAGCAILAGAVLDLRFFRDAVVGDDLQDLSRKMVLDARRSH